MFLRARCENTRLLTGFSYVYINFSLFKKQSLYIITFYIICVMIYTFSVILYCFIHISYLVCHLLITHLLALLFAYYLSQFILFLSHISLLHFHSISLCVYMWRELSYLSPEEPVSLVLFNRSDRQVKQMNVFI